MLIVLGSRKPGKIVMNSTTGQWTTKRLVPHVLCVGGLGETEGHSIPLGMLRPQNSHALQKTAFHLSDYKICAPWLLQHLSKAVYFARSKLMTQLVMPILFV